MLTVYNRSPQSLGCGPLLGLGSFRTGLCEWWVLTNEAFTHTEPSPLPPPRLERTKLGFRPSQKSWRPRVYNIHRCFIHGNLHRDMEITSSDWIQEVDLLCHGACSWNIINPKNGTARTVTVLKRSLKLRFSPTIELAWDASLLHAWTYSSEYFFLFSRHALLFSLLYCFLLCHMLPRISMMLGGLINLTN